MNDGRIKIIHQGYMFITFTVTFTNTLNKFSFSSVVDIVIEKIVSLN